MVSETGVEAQIDVVGGDIWNAYSGDLISKEAVDAIIYEPMANVTARPLNTIPGERQITTSGPQTMGPDTRRLRDPSEDSEGDGDQDFGTQEVEPKAILANLEQSADAESVGRSDSADELFDRHLTAGIKASLERNYKLAAESFASALEVRPGDTKAEFNLNRVRRYLS